MTIIHPDTPPRNTSRFIYFFIAAAGGKSTTAKGSAAAHRQRTRRRTVTGRAALIGEEEPIFRTAGAADRRAGGKHGQMLAGRALQSGSGSEGVVGEGAARRGDSTAVLTEKSRGGRTL